MSKKAVTILEKCLIESKAEDPIDNQLVIHFNIQNKGFRNDYELSATWLTKEEIEFVIKQLTQCPTYGYVNADQKCAILFKWLGLLILSPVIIMLLLFSNGGGGSSELPIQFWLFLFGSAICSLPFFIVSLFFQAISDCITIKKLKRKGREIQSCLDQFNHSYFKARGVKWSSWRFGERLIANYSPDVEQQTLNNHSKIGDYITIDNGNCTISLGNDNGDMYAKQSGN